MPFNCIAVPDNSMFKHTPSGNLFVLKRTCSVKKLILTLYHQKANGSEIKAGHISASCKFSRTLVFERRNDLDYFTIKFIFVNAGYRNTSLGTLLMLILTCEVVVNGGRYLYVVSPIYKAYGFYLQFGFHPAPENVSRNYWVALDNLEDPDAGLQFQDKFELIRSHKLWKGNIDIVYHSLKKKINSVFTPEVTYSG
ncbi:GNAT family N-acetyltransferase [Endozoicomonas lisbonensis]|uniref:GNAT superfamily N-acetyltransferase n=1 Tax=Endozoicomonas lisbonensis TaxID=3120522 RepID=A0ABV2SIP0_9GAMM